MKTTRLILGTALLAIAGGAVAADVSSDGMKRCAAMTDSLARLVCYDQLASGTPSPAAPARAPAAPAASTVAPAAVAAPVVAAPVAPKAPALGDDTMRMSDDEIAKKPTSLVAKITELQEVRTYNYYVTLDNGQSWMQEEVTYGFHLDVGDTIQIQKGKLGGYKLVNLKDGKPSGPWVRVTRKQ